MAGALVAGARHVDLRLGRRVKGGKARVTVVVTDRTAPRASSPARLRDSSSAISVRLAARMAQRLHRDGEHVGHVSP
jgi:hypothetical protein